MPRGSRKHVLDWTDQPRFLPELLDLVRPVSCKVTADSIWQPLGHDAPAEAQLEQFGPRADPKHPAWPVFTSWWLRHPRGAKTPNWDIALSCEVDGTPGLILVEAKANVPELSEAGKWEGDDPSPNSQQNREQIGKAIEEARVALTPLLPEILINREKHYQLSNRIAFAWKLASLGIPTIVMYLGFTGDTGISDVGAFFTDDEHWQSTIRQHVSAVCPPMVFDGPVDVGPASFWVLARSRPIISISVPAA